MASNVVPVEYQPRRYALPKTGVTATTTHRIARRETLLLASPLADTAYSTYRRTSTAAASAALRDATAAVPSRDALRRGSRLAKRNSFAVGARGTWTADGGLAVAGLLQRVGRSSMQLDLGRLGARGGRRLSRKFSAVNDSNAASAGGAGVSFGLDASLQELDESVASLRKVLRFNSVLIYIISFEIETSDTNIQTYAHTQTEIVGDRHTRIH